MEIKNLQKHIRTLATLEETEAPVVSCYLNLEGGQNGFKDFLDERTRTLNSSRSGSSYQYIEMAFARIKDFINNTSVSCFAKGVAIFARGGPKPLFLALQFFVPLKNWISVDTVPNIYPLVELKTNYDRYVLVISTKESAHILEVSIGEVTKELLLKHPELRNYVGQRWTREHYLNYCRERTDRFIREKIKILERIMLTGGHMYLILAGHPTMTSRVHKMLPKHLKAKLVNIFSASQDNGISEVVVSTLSLLIDQKAKESLASVDKLQQQINTNGLAVVGMRDSLLALKKRQAGILIFTKDYESVQGWTCAKCGDILNERSVCGACGCNEFKKFDAKQEMVRLAAQNDCEVEIVRDSKAFSALGGVGCLLRYKTPEEFSDNIQPSAEMMKINSFENMHKKRESGSYINFN